MTDFILLTPEIILTLTLALVLFGEITHRGEKIRLLTSSALIGLLAVFIQTVITYQYGATQVFHHTLSIDGLSIFFKLFFSVLTALAIWAGSQSREIRDSDRSEHIFLLLASCLAMCLSASASHLLVAFLALQMVNVLGTFLAGAARKSPASTEASAKHMIFAAVSGALMLYGISILFAATGTFNIHEIHRALVASPLPAETMRVVFLLTFLAVAFQFAAFPMSPWAPDVLEGAPTPSSAFLSVGTRAAGFAVALRFFIVVFAQPSQTNGQWAVLGGFQWPMIVSIFAGISMLVGALMASRQHNAKRLVGWLIVSQTGFMLLGLLVLDQVGIAALLYNLMIELFAVIGIFFVIAFLHDELRSDEMSSLKGMLRRAVPECICLVLFLATLIGLPPTPGFIGKFSLIGTALRHGWLVLSIVSIVSICLCVLGVARLSFSLIGDFRSPISNPVAPNFQRHAFLAAIALPMVLAGVFADGLFRWAGGSLGFILW